MSERETNKERDTYQRQRERVIDRERQRGRQIKTETHITDRARE